MKTSSYFQTTSVGCRPQTLGFLAMAVVLLLGQTSLAVTEPAAETPALGGANVQVVPEVQAVPQALREKFRLAPFYQKCVDLGGLPILGSANVSNYAMLEAAWIVRQMLSAHPEIADSLKISRVRIVVMAYNEYTTDVPEQADWKSKDYWDRRARGMGGDISSCGEENLLNYPNDPYSTENIFIHEFAHTIHDHGLKQLIPDFNERLNKVFEEAKEKGLWKNTYAITNAHEYWAEAVQDWFDNNRQNDSQHNHIHTRAQLLEYDPAVAALCREVFGDGKWRYKKPMERPAEQRRHLEGFDPAKSPSFKWRSGETKVESP